MDWYQNIYLYSIESYTKLLGGNLSQKRKSWLGFLILNIKCFHKNFKIHVFNFNVIMVKIYQGLNYFQNHN